MEHFQRRYLHEREYGIANIDTLELYPRLNEVEALCRV